MLGQPAFFFSYRLNIQFLIYLCDLRDAMLCHWSPLSFPAQPLPSEGDDFPKDRKYRRHVPIPTYLASLHSKSISC